MARKNEDVARELAEHQGEDLNATWQKLSKEEQDAFWKGGPVVVQFDEDDKKRKK
jgi:hypothetical protein